MKGYLDYVDIVDGDQVQTVKQVACGFRHTVCLTDDGQVYTWGEGR